MRFSNSRVGLSSKYSNNSNNKKLVNNNLSNPTVPPFSCESSSRT